ncbi:MAG TPA: MFS transporter, partial [Vicinamibacterales bacterium]|nr:MFS transporter [Vicinamibacterales bacterium]
MTGVLRDLRKDAWLLLATRFIRLFAYGSLSIVLVFYLVGIGLSEQRVGTLFTLTLAGDVAVSLFLTTRADRLGRRRVLLVGAMLMIAAGLTFAATHLLWLLMLAGTVGVISPSGNEVGPFLSIEQAALSHVVTARTRTDVFAWYTLVGAMATALGALAGGWSTRVMQTGGSASPLDGYRAVIMLYAALGAALALLFSPLSPATEVSTAAERKAAIGPLANVSGLQASGRMVAKLSHCSHSMRSAGASSSRASRRTGSIYDLASSRNPLE